MPKINREEYKFLKNLDDKWKWISRDKSKNLFAYSEKPVREEGLISYWSNETPYPTLDLIDEIHLFQFIQWGDKEPHNIAELIEEYESEETEEKKDIEWAKNQIDSEVIGSTDREDPHFYVNVGLKMALDFLEQLDEPEVLSQKLPVIPNFVAEYLDERKEYAIYKLLDSDFIYDIHDELARWLYYNDKKTNKERELSLVLAHIYGYEVEEEPKYIIDTDDIEISDGNHYLTNLTLSKDRVDFPIVGYKSDAIQFDDINQAQAIASYVGGRVEELK